MLFVFLIFRMLDVLQIFSCFFLLILNQFLFLFLKLFSFSLLSTYRWPKGIYSSWPSFNIFMIFSLFLKQGWTAKLKTSIIKWSLRWHFKGYSFATLLQRYKEAGMVVKIKSKCTLDIICNPSLWMFSKDWKLQYNFFRFHDKFFDFFWVFQNVL